MGYKKQKLILVRHGETEWNSAFRFQGQTDVPLGEEGRRQAALLADRLGAVEFDRVYSSPLSRAFETASIIRKRSSFPMDIVTRPELSEMCFGTWEGLTLSEIQKNDPPLFLSWREDPSSVSPPGGESFDGLLSRTGSILGEILGDKGRNILVVCHGGTIRAALVFLLKISFAAAWNVRVDNCSMTAIDVTPERTTLRYANDIIHLRVDGSSAVLISIF